MCSIEVESFNLFVIYDKLKVKHMFNGKKIYSSIFKFLLELHPESFRMVIPKIGDTGWLLNWGLFINILKSNPLLWLLNWVALIKKSKIGPPVLLLCELR